MNGIDLQLIKLSDMLICSLSKNRLRSLMTELRNQQVIERRKSHYSLMLTYYISNGADSIARFTC